VIKIAVYGKGGIGKSTTTSNISAALAEAGHTVMQIGCDPKADSTRTLTGGIPIPTVLDLLRRQGDVGLSDIVVAGGLGVLCVESGGPAPGVGCAGRGIITAFDKLAELGAYEAYSPDVVLYDVLGDVVCGGFSQPIRGGYADEVVIVSSGEMMSLYAASNIATAVRNFAPQGYARLRGIVQNSKGIEDEDGLVERAAVELETEVIFRLPRHPDVQRAEAVGKTVIEAYPKSEMSEQYRRLARLVVA
jgi:nitrogenase iron protein NifH